MKELVASAHGLLTVAILLLATAFVAVGKMTSDQWIDLAKWTLGIFSGTHAALGIATKRSMPPLPTAKASPKSSESSNA